MKKNLICLLISVIFVQFSAKADNPLTTQHFLTYLKPDHTLQILEPMEVGAKVMWFSEDLQLSEKSSHLTISKSGVYTACITTSRGQVKRQSVYVDVQAGTIVTLYIIGDSTVADYTTYVNDYLNTRYPLMGWGQKIYDFMVADSLKQIPDFSTLDSIIVDNRAVGGRSTKNFYEGGEWTPIYNKLKPGDFVMIQFGHNDASTADDRGIDTTGYKEYLRIYINNTREKGATPILITPVARNYPWSGGKLGNVHEDYWQAMHNVAKEMKVRLIDLTRRSQDFFSSKGQSFVTNNYFLNLDPGEYPGYPDGNSDGTHFNEEGAVEVARLVFEGMQELYSVSVSSNIDGAGSIGGDGWFENRYSPNAYVTAKPERGYLFVEWTGDVASSENPLVFETTNTSYAIEAVFEETINPQYTLDYFLEGEGGISIEPFGDLYEEGTDILINAIPADDYVHQSYFVDDVAYTTDNLVIEKVNADKFIYVLFVDESFARFPINAGTIDGGTYTTEVAYATDNECVSVTTGNSASISWRINSIDRELTYFYFRYQNSGNANVMGEVYLNGQKSRDMTFLPTDASAGDWSMNARIGDYFEQGDNLIELRFTGEAPIHIDQLLLDGKGDYSLVPPLGSGQFAVDGTEFIQVDLYPNPVSTSDQIVVNYKIGSKQPVWMSVWDTQGRIVSTSRVLSQQDSWTAVNTSSLKGIYYLRFQQGERQQIYRFVVP